MACRANPSGLNFNSQTYSYKTGLWESFAILHVKKNRKDDEMRTICDDTFKVSFPDAAQARAAVVNLKQALKFKTRDGKRIKHRRRKVRQKRVYYCSFCEGYHLTSWKWWIRGSKKRLSKQKRNESSFIIKIELPVSGTSFGEK